MLPPLLLRLPLALVKLVPLVAPVYVPAVLVVNAERPFPELLVSTKPKLGMWLSAT